MKIYNLIAVLCFFNIKFALACGITVSANNGAICIGKKDTLNVTGATTYTWLPGNINSASYTVTPTVTTIYTVYAQGAAGCKDTDYVTVTVNPLPASVTISAATNPVCQAVSPVLTANGANTYTWQPGLVSGNPYNPQPNNNTIYTVTGASAQGCTKTATILVTIKPALLPLLIDSAKQAIFATYFNNCDNATGNATYNLTVKVPNSPSISTYTINWGNGSPLQTGITAANFPQYITYPTYGVYSINVSATYTNGCIRDTVIKVINQTNPAIGISNVSGNTAGCGPIGYWFKMSNYQANTSGTTYLWNFGDGTPTVTWTNVTTDSIYHLFTTTSCGLPNNEFKVSVTAINSCDVTTASVGSIKIYKKPDSKLAASLTKACVGVPVTFFNNSTPSSNGPNCNNNTNYNWDFGDGNTLNMSGNTASVANTYTAVGNYSITLSAAGGCGTDTSIIAVCVEANIVDFTSSIPSNCLPANTKFTNTSPTTFNCSNAPFLWTVTKLSSTCTADSAINFVYINGTNASSPIPEIRFNNQGQYKISLSRTNACGLVVKDTIINFYTTPRVTLNPTANLCDGQSYAPVISTTNCGVNPLTYLWSAPGGTPNSSTTSNPSFLLPAGTNTVTINVTNECGTTNKQSVVTINPKPTITVSYNPNDSICANTTITLTASGANTYTWTPNTSLGANKIFTATTTNIYSVTATSAVGCTNQTTAPLYVYPSVSITASNTIPTCVPGGDATLSITTIGGTAPLQYSLNAGMLQNTPSFTLLSVGTYTIKAIDKNGCSANLVHNITASNSPQINSVNKANITCYGLANGSFTLNVSGGNGGNQYTLQPGALTGSSNIYSSLLPNTYTITVKDNNNCSSVTNVIITQPDSITWGTITVNPVSCFGLANGAVFAQATGGSTPYTFKLLPLATTNSTGNFNFLSPATYTLNITDAKGCSKSSIVNITQPISLVWDSVKTTNLICNGVASGAIKCHISTATSYNLLPINTNNSNGQFLNLLSGTYTIKGTDANGCSLTSLVIISQPSAIQISNISTTQASCNPGNDGSITVIASGGTGVLNYQTAALPIQTLNTITGLGIGNYVVTVSDANSCQKTVNTNVVGANAPSIISASVINPLCYAFKGQTTISATGGTGTLSYKLQPINAVSNTGIFTNLSANNYTVYVTDANLCVVSSLVNVTEPSELLWQTKIANPESCAGINNGSINTSVTGGTGIKSYQLQPNNIVNNTGNFAPLTSNTYTVIVKDANNCNISTTLQIVPAPSLVIDSLVTPPSSCNASSITVYAKGGSTPYSYALNTGSFNTTNLFTNLLANNYTLTVKDNNGCTITGTKSIVLATPPLINNASIKNIACHGIATGAVYNYTAINGVGSYTFNVLPGNSFNNLAAGTYSLTVKDANNCLSTSIINITQPNVIGINASSKKDISCNNANDGSIIITALGGVGVLKYKLMPTNITNTTGIFNGLTANNYSVVVADDSSCTYTATYNVINPAVLSFTSFNATPIKCFGQANGSVFATTTGGTVPYSFGLNPIVGTASGGAISNLVPNTYTLTVTDANNCKLSSVFNIANVAPVAGTFIANPLQCFGVNNGSIIATINVGKPPYKYNLIGSTLANNTTGIFNNLPAGNYTVILSDSNACSTSLSPIILSAPLPIQWTNINVPTINCFGGRTNGLSTIATGGTGLLLYAINPQGPQNNSTGSFNNLTAQGYTITVKDVNNCTAQTNVVILQNNEIKIDITKQAPLCFNQNNGKINIDAQGGVPPFTYAINNTPANNVNNNLANGIYTILTTDAKNCTVSTTVVFNTPSFNTLITLNVEGEKCLNSKDGIINIYPTDSGYKFALLPDSVSNYTGVFAGLASGTYSLLIINKNNCSFDTVTQVLPVFNPISASTIKQNLNCIGNGKEGWAEVNATGGAQPYNYYWHTIPPQFGVRAENLPAGQVAVTVTDAKGCTVKDTTVIENSLCCKEIFFPNIFSPNGDGTNDNFKPITSVGYDLIFFGVYDRFGQIVWKANSNKDVWYGYTANGIPLEIGTYYYTFKYKCLATGREYLLKGDVNLVR